MYIFYLNVKELHILYWKPNQLRLALKEKQNCKRNHIPLNSLGTGMHEYANMAGIHNNTRRNTLPILVKSIGMRLHLALFKVHFQSKLCTI